VKGSYPTRGDSLLVFPERLCLVQCPDLLRPGLLKLFVLDSEFLLLVEHLAGSALHDGYYVGTLLLVKLQVFFIYAQLLKRG
jgi:hypothetical protein